MLSTTDSLGKRNEEIALRIIFAVVLSLMIASASSFAADISKEESEKIEQVVHAYLLDNPEIVIEAIEKYRYQQEEIQKKSQGELLKKHLDFLLGKDRASAGNPEGDVTIVEFFDYNCGYCKRALADIMDVIESDKNVRIVLLDLPILSPLSEVAAKWALAAGKQGKYFDYHVALMKAGGQKSEAKLEELASELGLDVARLRKDAESEEISKELEKIREIATEVGVMGTPAFIIGDEFNRGYMGSVALKEAISKARESK